MTRLPPRSGLASGLLAAMPIMLGCFPIAVSYGVAATRRGLTLPEAVMLSAAFLAGAVTVLGVFRIWHSAVISTLAGAAAYGAMAWFPG